MEKKKNTTKSRLLYLVKYLYRETDENVQVTTQDLLDYLDAEGIPTDRKTLREAINSIIEAGMSVEVVRSKPNRYYCNQDRMELSQLEMLIDAVTSARFITNSRSKDLIEQLIDSASVSDRQKLERHVYVNDEGKTLNKSLYLYVTEINDAINMREKVSFQYYEYMLKDEKPLRHDGEVYYMSPYTLFWNDGFYYLIGWSDKHNDVTAFRVDHMTNLKRETEMPARPMPAKFDVQQYTNRVIGMYKGESTKVRLECHKDRMRYVIDRFGQDVERSELEGDRVAITATVDLSPTFYAWLFTFGGEIELKGPEKAISEFRDMAQRILQATAANA